MRSAVYFLSDMHLGAEPPGAVPHREERLVEFLQDLRGKASDLFLVGDLFEFWWEYRHYAPRGHFPFLRALADLAGAGVSVRVLLGNHDFAYRDFFPRELGIPVFRNWCGELQGLRAFVCHGDGLAASDGAYRLARRVLDFAPNRFLFGLLHPDLGMRLARLVGGTSRDANKDRRIPVQEYLDAASKIMENERASLFVHAHNHQGGLWHLGSAGQGTVLNPGQWLFELGYGVLEQGIPRFVPLEHSKSTIH
jgi:UDP-2,3-diacylglucosamine hydrolase